VKSITYNKYKEFADHARVDQALGSTSNFADPFSCWQRGTNENLNGLVRQYIPKKPIALNSHRYRTCLYRKQAQ
jgi:IS30 family transposase